MNKKKCKICLFVDDEQCRRFPPIYSGDSPDGVAIYDYPYVTKNDWCGEFKYNGPALLSNNNREK